MSIIHSYIFEVTELYWVINRQTGEEWTGQAESSLAACQLAGWTVNICCVRQKSKSKKGGWRLPSDFPLLGKNFPAARRKAHGERIEKYFPCPNCKS